MIKAEQDLPGTEGGKGQSLGEGSQTMYAHVNK
jgi:hypothetical protein